MKSLFETFNKKSNSITSLPEFKVNISGLKLRSGVRERQMTKLGGNPDWLQSPKIPICRKCGKPMTFVAQIDSLDYYAENAKGYMFGDCGRIYTFICTQDSCDNWDKPISILQYS